LTRRRFDDDDNIDQFCLFTTLRLKNSQTISNFLRAKHRIVYVYHQLFFIRIIMELKKKKKKNYEIFRQKFFAGSQKPTVVQKT